MRFGRSGNLIPEHPSPARDEVIEHPVHRYSIPGTQPHASLARAGPIPSQARPQLRAARGPASRSRWDSCEIVTYRQKNNPTVIPPEIPLLRAAIDARNG